MGLFTDDDPTKTWSVNFGTSAVTPSGIASGAASSNEGSTLLNNVISGLFGAVNTVGPAYFGAQAAKSASKAAPAIGSALLIGGVVLIAVLLLRK